MKTRINIRLNEFGKPTPLYRVWRGIKYRCNNPHSKSFADYGKRGIKVCKSWSNFENFHFDMAPSYKPGLSIERINNHADYGPNNCRWATRIEQANNKRNVGFIEYEGKRLTLAQWARETGIKKATLFARLSIHKWPLKEALTKARRPRKTKIFGLPADHIINVDGKDYSLEELVEKTNLKFSTITSRYYCRGWPIEKCFTEEMYARY